MDKGRIERDIRGMRWARHNAMAAFYTDRRIITRVANSRLDHALDVARTAIQFPRYAGMTYRQMMGMIDREIYPPIFMSNDTLLSLTMEGPPPPPSYGGGSYNIGYVEREPWYIRAARAIYTRLPWFDEVVSRDTSG